MLSQSERLKKLLRRRKLPQFLELSKSQELQIQRIIRRENLSKEILKKSYK
tara:strand:- start:266 stop:418 length:153 start_codon:yes stop_codon:yes gene_type:complete